MIQEWEDYKENKSQIKQQIYSMNLIHMMPRQRLQKKLSKVIKDPKSHLAVTQRSHPYIKIEMKQLK